MTSITSTWLYNKLVQILIFKRHISEDVCPITDVSPPSRPILPAIGTPSYKLAKFLVPKLFSITFNEFTVKHSFAFAEEIVSQDGKLIMGSLDVDLLFPNIPLKPNLGGEW